MKNRKYSPNNTKNIDLFYFQKHNISSKGKKKIKKKNSIPISPNFSTNSTSVNFFSNTISPKINNKSHLHLQIDSIINKFKLHPLIINQIEKEKRKEKLNSLSLKDFTILFDDDDTKTKKKSKSNLSKTLLNTFNKKTKNILDTKKQIPKFSRNIISFRNQIIQNFTDKFYPNQLKKSKKYYNEVMKYLDNKEKEKIIKAEEYDKEFYQIRLSKKPTLEFPQKKKTKKMTFLRNINTAYKQYKNSQNIQKYQSQQFIDPFYNSNSNNYEDIQYVHSQGNSHSRLNLERVIRMVNLKSSGFHSDDELFEGNPKGLKKLINKSEEDVYKRIKGYIPHFITEKIRKSTISKFKQLNGMFFGMPV